MLSFLTDTCEQLAEGLAHEACEWAVSNPAIALGMTAGSLLATAASGLYFYNRRPAANTPVPTVPVARLARQTVCQTISDINVDQSKLVAPSAGRRIPVQTIVLGELHRQLQNPATAVAARQLLDLRQTKGKQIDSLVLNGLGLPEDGKMPQTEVGQARHDAVVTTLNMSHLRLR